MNNNPFFEINNLHIRFPTNDGFTHAVDGFSLGVRKAELIALVGESGSGKTISMLSSLGLNPPKAIVTGSIKFNNQEIRNWESNEWMSLRGRIAGLVLQNPVSSLNPHLCIGEQIWEAALSHNIISPQEKVNFAIDLLRKVGINHPEKRWNDFPHQFSGGMCQRVMIAAAISCNPNLIILDEPTTALDVTIERQIIKLLMDLRDELSVSQILITHNLKLALHYADTIAIMFGGTLLEKGSAYHILNNPRHPYTRFLLNLAFTTPLERRRKGWSAESIAPWQDRIIFQNEPIHFEAQVLHEVQGEKDHYVNHKWISENWWDLGCRI